MSVKYSPYNLTSVICNFMLYDFVSDLMFGQCVWHCPQQSVACVHCCLFHSNFQHIASADQSTNLHRLVFWGEERWMLVAFLISMDYTSTQLTWQSLRGGNNEEGEAIKRHKRLILGLPNHLFSILKFHTSPLVVQFAHGCPKGTSPQWLSSSPEST